MTGFCINCRVFAVAITLDGADIPAVHTRYRISNRKGELILDGRSNDAGEAGLSINEMPDDSTIQPLRD
ncbi:hypothetical protein [Alcaligenes sp. SDU_A2]|uniref:hypothetical protein n=1 Tax=Alcaligenes sp. SDU_A2 TaxID=3136634 RepID=UPI00312006AD